MREPHDSLSDPPSIATLDCGSCGACCREAFDVVAVEPDDPMGPHPDLVREHLDGWRSMRRVPGLLAKDQCAALEGNADREPWRCTIYGDRPVTCRELETGSEDCLLARRRLGFAEI